jgi:hypothetical protein
VLGCVIPAAVASAQPSDPSTTSSSTPATSTTAQGSTTTLVPQNLIQQAQADAQSQMAVTGEIDALRASDGQVKLRLADITNKLKAEQVRLAAAQDAAAKAAAAADAAAAALSKARDEAARTEREVRDMAIGAYMSPPGDSMASVLTADSFEAASQRKSVIDLQARRRASILDGRKSALKVLEKDERAAHDAKDAADSTAHDEQAAVDQLTLAQKQEQQFSDALEQRLDNSLSEADGLLTLDPNVAAQLLAQANALGAAALAAGLPPGVGGPNSPLAPVPIVNVGGFNVNVAIAPQMQALLTAFAATGHHLGGGAYRSAQQQIALRIAHCGSDPYSIYQKPSSQCSPPTAPPGRSMHEVGLAIDFQCDGALISSHDNFCFQWLSLNGATFGLQNLPSEPWHWSTNGN